MTAFLLQRTFFFATFIIATSFLFPTKATAEGDTGDSRQGLYLGVDVGLWLPSQLKAKISDTDVPTNCDQHLVNSDGTPVNEMKKLEDEYCARGNDAWENSFDLGLGFMTGLHLGYAMKAFRFEAEYFHRGQPGQHSSLELTSGGKDEEFVEAAERISDFQGSHLFANFYYDLLHVMSPKFIPYFGIGLGLAYMEMNYSVKFIRNASDSTLEGLGRNPNAAGTASLAEHTLYQTLYGYQIMAGFDYALGERFYIGAKLRYGDFFTTFENSNEWDKLRSHNSTITPDAGHAPVLYTFKGENLNFLGLSLSLKYFL